MGRLITQGAKGADVRAIQDVLNFHIRRLTALKVDGIFGPRTHARVVEFQKSNQLKPDGIVGPKTLGKLFEEEALPISFALLPQLATASGIRPPRLIPPLTLPPLTPPLVTTPFLLPPASSAPVPTLTSSGQAVTFLTTVPVRNDPVDPAMRSFLEIMRLLDRLPQSFPFRGTIVGAVPKPVTKVGPLELDPVGPLNFGFKWGVDPVFDLTSIGPPVEFKVGGDVKARYVLKLIDKPGALVPRLGLFVQGDFRGTIDWTSKAAESRPEIDLNGSFVGGLVGRF
jgi:peptidoglycan hydrolase-like protein with peptidoglycan-binding domain